MSVEMSYTVFDTETTGLPKTRQPPTKENLECWDECRILSIAAITYSSRGRELSRFYTVIKPDGFKVAATEVHGITEEEANTNGIPFEEAYKKFIEMTHNSNKIIGHNLKFDIGVLKAETIRRNLDFSPIEKLTPVCTLDLVKKWYGKPKKLIVIYEELFGKEFEGAHNALFDTQACAEVYAVIKDDPRKYKPISQKKIILKASEVAACIGKNQFKRPQEVLDDMWKKYSPETFKGKTKDDYAMEAIEADQKASEIFKEVEKASPKNSSDVMKIMDEVSLRLKVASSLQLRDFYSVKDFFRKTLFTNFGTKNESKTADADSANLYEDDTFYKYKVCEIEGTTYEIVGRIDRFEICDYNQKILVEIKNRTRCLFNTVKEYEAIQVQTYLQMVKLNMARLIEQHNDERKSYMIMRDDEKWDREILPGLKEFCKVFHANLSQ
jgi:DNA polymerase III epsilon subunit-like protein